MPQSTTVHTRSDGSVFEASYRALSYGFRLRTVLPDVGSSLDRVLAPFRISDSKDLPVYTICSRPAEDDFVVSLDGEPMQEGRSLPSLLDWLLWDVNWSAIEGADDFLIVHASAASRGGRGIVFPAPPDSGKSTLVAGLVRGGFDYLTDEAALISPATGWLHPFPRAIWLEPPSLDIVPGLKEMVACHRGLDRRYYQVPADALRRDSIGTACPLRFVVIPELKRGTPARLEPIGRGETLLGLAQNSINFKSYGGRGIEILGRALAGARCYRLTMGDLDDAVEVVRSLIDNE